jgi:octanoyl-[GcvH]:protein N-octanoyltransferase
MRVIRGRAATPAADNRRTERVVDEVRSTGEPALRVWQPHRIVAFGRRDTTHDRYKEARQIARERGYTPIERSVGGNAVAYTGTTIAFVKVVTTDAGRTEIQQRYEETMAALLPAFEALGVDVVRGEPDGAFCPGTHSLSSNGKLAGLAQRVKDDVALVSGIVLVRDHETISDVLEPIYDYLDIAFDRSAVASIASAGGADDPDAVRSAIERALTPDEYVLEALRET